MSSQYFHRANKDQNILKEELITQILVKKVR